MTVVAKPGPLAVPVRHLRAPRPVHFPVEATVPETNRHLELRTLLYLLLKTFAARHTIGSDQFVYWSADDPRRCLAPDAFVRLGTPHAPFDSWKTWERGAPELCVEIVSEFDASDRSWERKLKRYRKLGVLELVRFDADAPSGARLRVWDRLEGDLVERQVDDERTPCATLGLHWVVVPVGAFPAGLRLARDVEGRELLQTPEEAEAEARRAAERRVAELEAELARRGG